jgi:hypothetical protein
MFGWRLEESLYYIAEILSHFDLIAVQEVREDLQALDDVMRILGPGWRYIATDVTEGKSGNRERMVFVYNSHKTWFRNIAGEVLLPQTDLIAYPHEERLKFDAGLALGLPPGSPDLESPPDVKTYRRSGVRKLKAEVEIELPEHTMLRLPAGSRLVLPRRYPVDLTDEGRVVLPGGSSVEFPGDVMVKLPAQSIVGDALQFARSPFLVSFQASWLKLNLCTVHIYYGSGKEGMERRKEEIRQLTKFLAQRASSDNDSDADSFFIVLGDFNIVDKEHATMEALRTNGFDVPAELEHLPGSNVKQDKYYDQIAYWSASQQDTVTRIDVRQAGVFDFFDVVFRTDEEEHYIKGKGYKPTWKYKDWRTHQMSDHLPMWVELRIDFGDEYLERIVGAGPDLIWQ